MFLHSEISTKNKYRYRLYLINVQLLEMQLQVNQVKERDLSGPEGNLIPLMLIMISALPKTMSLMRVVGNLCPTYRVLETLQI